MSYITFSNVYKVCAIGQGTWNMGRNTLWEKTETNALQRNIPVIAYFPVGEGKLLRHPVLKTVAEKHSVTPAQIALARIIRNPGVMAIPKASVAEHVRENFGSISIALDAEDIDLLDISFPAPQQKIPLAGW